MLNMIDTQDKLKNFSEQQLIQEMQQPSGSAPQFMVLGEIERRKRMRADAQRQEGLMQPTVAQEAVSAAGVPQQGITQVAQSLAPQTDMTQNTGVPNVQAAGLPGQPNQPQRMADGGILRLQVGGYPDDLSKSVGSALSYNISNQGRGVNTLNANVIDAYLRGELDPNSKAYRDLSTFEELNGRDKLREISSQIANPYGRSPSYSSRDEITPRMSQEDAMATRRRLASGIGTGAGIASVPAALPYERGAGRATRVNGTFVEVMPDGNVFDIETGDMVTGELAQAAVTKLTPNLTVDSAAFAEAQGMPSVYNPEAGMPSQADLDLRAAEAPAPDRFPNDLSPAETAAAYNAAQEKRRAEAARMTGINQIPTTQPTFTDDVLPFVGGVAGDLASLPFDIIGEGLEPFVDQTKEAFSNPVAAFKSEMAGRQAAGERNYANAVQGVEALNQRIAEANADGNEILAQQLTTARDQLGGTLRNQERAAKVAGGILTIPTAINRAFQQSSLGVGLRGPDATAQTLTELEAEQKAATEAEATREQRLAELLGGATPTSTAAAKAAQEEFSQRPDTQDVKPAAEQEKIAAAMKTVTDPAAMPPAIKSGTGKKSGIAAEKSKMDQDKWLALAQAGFTLMSTGDFGKAGAAGLAALREAKKGDREERKLDAELKLREAQLAKANRAPAAKAIPAAYLTDLRKQMEDTQEQLASLRPPEEGGFWSSGSDPDAATRKLLTDQIRDIQDQIDFMYRSRGLPTVSNTATRTKV